MKCSATLRYKSKNSKELYELLKSEDYDFKNKQISIEISVDNVNSQVLVEIEAQTPQLLKIVTTAINDSCEVIRKTQEVIQIYTNKNGY
ncbi:MAG: hypothetical protein ACMXYB_00200 [Candidatus Woesearchaeota archaeon]